MAIVVKPAVERGKIAPFKMGHVALKVRNLQEMIKWYGTVLEAEISYANDDVAFMAYDDEHHRIALVKLPELELPAENATGMDHCSFSYKDLGELLASYKRIKATGIEPFWCIIHGPSTSMYYKDPDGNKIELMIDNFETQQELVDFFDGGAYEENFMGIMFDPDEMAEKFDAGVPAKELTKRGTLPDGMSPWDMLRS
ncbi:MAG: biphenyl 2,3-dioxygenase [Rhodospirillaceae bacterium]|jgi:catechol 2,3-dioxygenase-like lactoylglutathione lyase family enzyme|nr:biphenyl 2,3-dioxygenase [Rhodospirillaceae bacterium]MBT4938687.1 biphenyl 2,3-dioxygenase [Rhodospirillaceae bacterium]MBT5938607.1 biphenyl 2,3-dioxygenase [Rhodospirillaceae bacterium]